MPALMPTRRVKSFNSRTLGRVRLSAPELFYFDIQFQFTHPGKGATHEHTPPARCWQSFNSRTLGRVRRGRAGIPPAPKMFQFTHPGKGATLLDSDYLQSSPVSIHAPWEGCDGIASEALVDLVSFQFTHPGKGATDRDALINRLISVSIHAPWEGCDSADLTYRKAEDKFQFTHPGKGATVFRLPEVPTSGFNSRTLGRVRLRRGLPVRSSERFQFTHPGKGATANSVEGGAAHYVSIHAPWEGCDRAESEEELRTLSFNSRTLGRVRLAWRTAFSAFSEFQFTHPGKGATVWCKVAYYRADKQA